MCVLIGNTVKTAVADYPCATREEAEALFLQLRQREAENERRDKDRDNDSIHRAAKHAERHATD